MRERNHSVVFHWLVTRWVATFALMVFGFVAFGAASLNLVQTFAANTNFLVHYGWDALVDGGAWQFVQLTLTACVAVAFYIVFKTCEHALVERIAHVSEPHVSADRAP